MADALRAENSQLLAQINALKAKLGVPVAASASDVSASVTTQDEKTRLQQSKFRVQDDASVSSLFVSDWLCAFKSSSRVPVVLVECRELELITLLLAVFKEFDRDGNGVIDKEEFAVMAFRCGASIDALVPEAVDASFRQLTTSSSKGITFDEFHTSALVQLLV